MRGFQPYLVMPLSPRTPDLPHPLPPMQNARSVFPIVIRSVQEQDLPRLAEVLAHSFHSQEGLWGMFYTLLRMGIYEDLRSRLRNKAHQYACLVAVQGGQTQTTQLYQYQLAAVPGMGDRPIGTVELTVRTSQLWQPHLGKGYLYLSNLAVHADFRQHGVAQQLLQTCEQKALEWGFENIYLHVLENNYSARRLYRKAGYQLHEVEAGLGTWLLGQPKQLFLRKVLGRQSIDLIGNKKRNQFLS
jgi:ribosomal protein S18 acetylase RimI-like enzyme